MVMGRVFRRFVEVVEVGTNPTGRRLQARASDDQACRPFELSITFDYGAFKGGTVVTRCSIQLGRVPMCLIAKILLPSI